MTSASIAFADNLTQRAFQQKLVRRKTTATNLWNMFAFCSEPRKSDSRAKNTKMTQSWTNFVKGKDD